MPFRDVIGHRRLIGLLARSINRGTLPPSLILAGPSGVGKRLVAVASAQLLNCTARALPESGGQAAPGIEADSCGVCTACVRIARGMHPDVLILEPGDSGSIRIEQVRETIDHAAYRPFEGRRRVIVIDDADMMVPAAQNALLKTLEEPPSSSVFLLVTSRPDTLLPTVRSRCPRLRFRALSTDEVVAALVQQGRGELEARTVAAVAGGSIGRALEASAGDLAEARDVAARVLAQVASTADLRRRIEAAQSLTLKSGGADRQQLAAELRAMASLVRDAALLGAGAERRALANPDLPSIAGLAVFGGERGTRAFSAIDRALAALERNASAKIVADWLVLHL